MARLKGLPPRLRQVDTRAVRPVATVKRADAELLTEAHRAWREAVCERAGWRCQWVENGVRCTRSREGGHRMVADHVVERADGGAALDPANGQCLCVAHNTRKGAMARAARLGRAVGG